MYLTDTPQLELQFFLLHISDTHARYFMATFMAPAALATAKQQQEWESERDCFPILYLIRAAKWAALIQRLLLPLWQRICEIKSDSNIA